MSYKGPKILAIQSSRDQVSYLLNRSDLTLDERLAIERAIETMDAVYVGAQYQQRIKEGRKE